MPTIKPANFPRIYRGVPNPYETKVDQKVRETQKASKNQKSGSERVAVNKAADEQKPVPPITSHTSQAKRLKLYQPDQVKLKRPLQLGQFIDIKI